MCSWVGVVVWALVLLPCVVYRTRLEEAAMPRA